MFMEEPSIKPFMAMRGRDSAPKNFYIPTCAKLASRALLAESKVGCGALGASPEAGRAVGSAN